MKIEHAHTIPLREILFKLGLKPLKNHKNTLVYLSPFSLNKTPTFKLYTHTNTWHDSASDCGGTTVEFAQAHLKNHGHHHTETDALRWLKNISFNATLAAQFAPKPQPDFIIRNILPLTHVALLRYLDKRKIERRYIADHFRELRVFNPATRKLFRAIGFRNEEDGYALYNPATERFTKPHAISFIRGTTPKPDSIHLFKDIFDYLSLLSARRSHLLEGDAIILNRYSSLDNAVAYIRNYGYLNCYLWLDNSADGFKAAKLLTPILSLEDNLIIKRMNSLYVPYQSLNDWWIHNPKNLIGNR
ncbi:MAG: hypothetical protein BGO69_10755 [Bacteroidetes bacterium 46-16]|nr:MAG: hypothetical protein BGO69_10755 [Bacteroidetes bacterium 46-16]